MNWKHGYAFLNIRALKQRIRREALEEAEVWIASRELYTLHGPETAEDLDELKFYFVRGIRALIEQTTPVEQESSGAEAFKTGRATASQVLVADAARPAPAGSTNAAPSAVPAPGNAELANAARLMAEDQRYNIMPSVRAMLRTLAKALSAPVSADQRITDLEAKLDAIAEAIGHPRGAWKLAGCDVLAHYVRDLLNNYTALRDAPVPAVGAADAECICKGNWRAIVKESEPKLGRKYKADWGPDGKKDYEYTFFGIVHGSDDYYYGMVDKDNKMRLLSCVGNIESFGFYEILPSGRNET